jgi:hypothetical protein
MFEEEGTIYQKYKGSNFNQQLVEELEKLKKEYEMFFNTVDWENNNEALPTLYDLIESVNKIGMVKEQMNAIQEYQQQLLTSNEQDFSYPTTTCF